MLQIIKTYMKCIKKSLFKCMRPHICLFVLFLLFNFGSSKTHEPSNYTVISQSDFTLYKLICDYRKLYNLDSIPLSSSLCQVALAHTVDLAMNHPDNNGCNLHSWSGKGKVRPCCYKGGTEAECMWRKPSELTSYKWYGYEIAAWSSTPISPSQALEMWKKSNGHNSVLTNQNIWKDMNWKAIGVSVYKNYAVVWFGTEPDTETPPSVKPQ